MNPLSSQSLRRSDIAGSDRPDGNCLTWTDSVGGHVASRKPDNEIMKTVYTKHRIYIRWQSTTETGPVLAYSRHESSVFYSRACVCFRTFIFRNHWQASKQIYRLINVKRLDLRKISGTSWVTFRLCNGQFFLNESAELRSLAYSIQHHGQVFLQQYFTV